FHPTNEWFAHARPMQLLIYDVIEEGKKAGELKTDIRSKQIVEYIFDIFRGVCYNWCIHGADFDITRRMENHISLLCEVLKK
ncbi:MAG: hypothetical protein J6P94_00625, partial [Oscillospiraceae bacterium]|nr:hypothetical protein [Oscillospiraceae bacterium]